MTIGEAMRAVMDDYDAEVERAQREHPFGVLMAACMKREYVEVDQALTGYVAQIANQPSATREAMIETPEGLALSPWVYQMAAMCFRMGMRVQRKLDRPSEPTSMFWRSDEEVI